MPPSAGLPRISAPLLAQIESGTLPDAMSRIEVLQAPTERGYRYAHHPHIVHAFGQFLAMWSSGFVREDRPGQRVMWSRSDGRGGWSPPEVLVQCPAHPWRLTAGGWAMDGDRLIAIINRNRWPEEPGLQPGTVWYPPLYVDAMEAGPDLRWSAPRAFDADLLANESPRRTSRGTWLLAGYSARMEAAVLRSCAGPVCEPEFHPVPRITIPACELATPRATPPVRPLGEPTWYERRDGSIVCLMRDDHGSNRLFGSVSADDGVTWSRPAATDIPDAKAKCAALALANGMTVLVCNPCVAQRRRVLAALFTADGAVFDRGVCIRRDDASALAYPGLVEHDGRLHVVHSIAKSAIAVASFDIAGALWAAAPAPD